MDQPVAPDDYRGGAAGGHRRDGGCLVLFHTEIHARWLPADSARAFLSRDSRGPAWLGLPLLPHWRGEIMVLEYPGGVHLHELTQPGAEG